MVIARHGRTAWHDRNRYTGRSDIPLDDTGVDQARALAEWAREFAPDLLFHSPMLRARQTSAPIAEALDLPVRTDERLRELDFGSAEGLSLTDLDPEVARSFREDPVAHHFPGGEDPRVGARRVTEWVHEVAEAHRGARVLVVAHNTLIRLLMCHVMGIPLSEYRRRLPGVDPTGLTRLRVEEGRVGLEAYNVPVLRSADRAGRGEQPMRPVDGPDTP